MLERLMHATRVGQAEVAQFGGLPSPPADHYTSL